MSLPAASYNFSMETKSDLDGSVDNFNGIIVDSVPEDTEMFSVLLQASLEVWKQEGRRGIWLKLPMPSHGNLVPEALSQGFECHHCQKDYIMMTKWLPDTPSTIPEYASHYIGVGGFVVNEKREVLVIKEKNGPAKSIWKIPGGMSDQGEDVGETAIREVMEETGIPCEFVCVLGFRQHHNIRFGKSDMYFVCFLKPKHNNITIQESEIADAKWMNLDEFIALPYYGGVYKKLLELGRDYIDGKQSGVISESLPIVFRPGNNTVYFSSDSRL